MSRSTRRLAFWLVSFLLALASGAANTIAAPPEAQGRADQASNMALVGYDDLQNRSAYQPVIHHQGNRWIAYIGLHGGEALNPLTGRVEPNGTAIVDVTDPARPRFIYHVPGLSGGTGEAGGAQMVRICSGLAGDDPARTHMLRTLGNQGHEVWDVTNTSAPTLVSTIVTGLDTTHKNWWECDTGVAYLVSFLRAEGWRSRGVKIYDLSDPANPRFIRDFGLVGQEPGSTGQTVPVDLHGPIRTGNRVYFGYGTSRDGVMQIVDREKLLTGDPSAADPFAPTRENLLYPQISRLDTSSSGGAHTTFPVLGVPILGFANNSEGRTGDFVVLVNESTQNECFESRKMMYMIDITIETRPFGIANFQVPESSGDFCARGGRFGAHSSNESFTPIYYGRMMFIAYFNAGVRAVDIRDPYHPTEVGYFIPATTEKTDVRCVTTTGSCKVAIQTNNVEVDDRGYIYIVDRANTGMHILELTGPARGVANFP